MSRLIALSVPPQRRLRNKLDVYGVQIRIVVSMALKISMDK